MFVRLLIADIKAMVFKLPKIVAGGFVLVMAVMMVAFAITQYSQNVDNSKSVIAVYAPPDTFTQLALNAIENMESVSRVCKFERVSGKEAEAMLLDNRASAAIIFGDNFVEDIIAGKKNQPRVMVSQNSSGLFMDLTNCGSSMIAIAQASIYSAEAAYYAQTGEKIPYELDRELDMEYINTVFGREKVFKESADSRHSVMDYYVCMNIPVFLLLLTMGFSTILFNQSKQFYECTRVNKLCIFIIQFIKAFLVLLFAFCLLYLGCMAFDMNIKFNIIPVFIIALVSTVVYSISGNKINGSLFLMILTIVMGFLGGAFLPPSLMPDVLINIVEFSPVNIMGLMLMA